MNSKILKLLDSSASSEGYMNYASMKYVADTTPDNEEIKVVARIPSADMEALSVEEFGELMETLEEDGFYVTEANQNERVDLIFGLEKSIPTHILVRDKFREERVAKNVHSIIDLKKLSVYLVSNREKLPHQHKCKSYIRGQVCDCGTQEIIAIAFENLG